MSPRLRARTTPFQSLAMIGVGVVGLAGLAGMNSLVSDSDIPDAGVPGAFFLLPLLPIVIGVVTLLIPGGVTTARLDIEDDEPPAGYCPACGAASARGGRFCRSCGNALPSDS